MNLSGPFLLCQQFGAMMLGAGSGSIVNVGSIAGLRGIADRAAYNASKHGLVGLTRTLAAEWGGRGVRVNAVCPGWVKTEMDTTDQASGADRDDDIVAQVPMGRFATPEDVAAAVASWPTRRAAGSSTASPCRWTAAGPPMPAGPPCACANAGPEPIQLVGAGIEAAAAPGLRCNTLALGEKEGPMSVRRLEHIPGWLLSWARFEGVLFDGRAGLAAASDRT